MRRREFITLLGGAAVVWPRPAAAQQPAKVHRVALIATTSPAELIGATPINPGARAFVQGLHALGYVEGRKLALEMRSAFGRLERSHEIMRELISINADVIVTPHHILTRAAKDVTQTVPIVMLAGSPVEEGLIDSLTRPGGNITGLTIDTGA